MGNDSNDLALESNETYPDNMTQSTRESLVEQVYLCRHETAGNEVIVSTEQPSCPKCNRPMENIGWFETKEERRRSSP